jgi:spermidine synthase
MNGVTMRRIPAKNSMLIVLPMASGLVLAGFILLGAIRFDPFPEETLVASFESSYQTLYLTTQENVVYLRAGSLSDTSSAMDLDMPDRHVLEYTAMMMLGLGYVEEPRNALVLGLGGGTVTKYLRRYYPELRIVNLEFDDTVVHIAKEHFGFVPDPLMEVVVEDGRNYLSRPGERFDLIFLDAYHGGYIPFHLMTREFLEIVRARMTERGVVVANTWRSHALAQWEAATYAAVFGGFDVYDGRASTNRIVVAGRSHLNKGRDELLESMASTQDVMGFREIDLVELFERHYRSDIKVSTDARVLEDDFAPVNMLKEHRTVR